jgi:hypothetical protein
VLPVLLGQAVARLPEVYCVSVLMPLVLRQMLSSAAADRQLS